MTLGQFSLCTHVVDTGSKVTSYETACSKEIKLLPCQQNSSRPSANESYEFSNLYRKTGFNWLYV